MTNTITLTNPSINSGTAIKLLNSNFSYGWKNLEDSPPSLNSFGNVESQFSGWENPILTLNFHIPINNNIANGMTWALWNEIAKNQYDADTASTKTVLNISVGSSDSAFTDYSLDSTSSSLSSIPVIVKTYSLTFSPGDSHNSNFWSIKAVLKVTS